MLLFDALSQFNVYNTNDNMHIHLILYLSVLLFFCMYLYNITFHIIHLCVITAFLIFYVDTVNFTLIITFTLIYLLVFQLFCSINNTLFSLLLDLLKFVLIRVYEVVPLKLNVFSLFLFIVCFFLLAFNLIGLLPYSTAITSHFIFAFFFSLIFFIMNIIMGYVGYKTRFFELFLPDNVPLWIIPMLILIELVSFISRVFSLAIRLFANIVAGHILLKILISFIYLIISIHLSMAIPSILGLIGISMIVTLELFIGLLQVYIFILLLIVYMGSIIKLH